MKKSRQRNGKQTSENVNLPCLTDHKEQPWTQQNLKIASRNPTSTIRLNWIKKHKKYQKNISIHFTVVVVECLKPNQYPEIESAQGWTWRKSRRKNIVNFLFIITKFCHGWKMNIAPLLRVNYYKFRVYLMIFYSFNS